MKPYKGFKPSLNLSGMFAFFNSSKYGMALDLNKPRGREIASRLIAWADVVIENFTPGRIKKWGLDYESASKIAPAIIYLSSSMFGQSGPRVSYRGYGQHAAAIAGINNLMGWPDRGPGLPYGAYTDYVSPRFAAVAILAALEYRRRTGFGQYIDQSQLESLLHYFAPVIMDYHVNKRLMKREGNRLLYAAPHSCYCCNGDDRWCVIAVMSDSQWIAFCKAIGNKELSDNPRFATLLARKEHEDELDEIVEEWTSKHSPEEVMKILQSAGVPAGAVENGADLFDDPQLNFRKHLRWLEHQEMGVCVYDALPHRLSKCSDQQFAAPCLGQHSEYICRELLGLSEEEIGDLYAEQVITTEADLPW
jgi:benzylsuccinate CoA-transferase BbsF subunit